VSVIEREDNRWTAGQKAPGRPGQPIGGLLNVRSMADKVQLIWKPG